jgi:hypothetical protein
LSARPGSITCCVPTRLSGFRTCREAGIILACLIGMDIPNSTVKCYTAAFHNREIDPYLEDKGFTHGMIIFSVPAYGILFRCRAQGTLIDLEFGALFALLKFVKNRLAGVKIKAVTILSSNPEFVFSFTGNTRHFEFGGERVRLLTEFSKQFKLSIAFVEPIENKALISPADYPSLPEPNEVSLKPDPEDLKRISFGPFQTGLEL